MRRPRWITCSVFAGFLILGGCFGGQPTQDYYYRLNVPDPETRFNPTPLNGTLQVARPRADALTGERHLVYRQDGNISRLNHHAYHRWVDSPTLLLQQEMAHYLRKAGLAQQVVIPEMRVKADYILSCRMAKLERVLDHSPRVILELELGITSMNDRQPLLLRSYREEQPSRNQDVAASINAYNQALSKILNRFLADASQLSFVQLTDTKARRE